MSSITDTIICGGCGGANGEHRVACSKFGGKGMSEPAALNTDVEIWRGKSRAEWGDADSFYADSLFIPNSEVEALGINCGGTVIVKPVREWHALGAKPLPTTAEETSVGMFNALADQIRESHADLRDGLLNVINRLEAIQLGQKGTAHTQVELRELAQEILKPHWPVVHNMEENEARQKEVERIMGILMRVPAKPQPSGKRGKGRKK